MCMLHLLYTSNDFCHHDIKTNIYLWSLHIDFKSVLCATFYIKFGGPADEIEVTKT